MTTVFLVVAPRGTGFVATSRLPEITALGSSAVVAAENGILAARALLGTLAILPTVVIRVDTPGRNSIIMQPIDKPVCLDPVLTGDAAI